jgi:squalene-hopene/tetraprenyl-beta-curcumene cyclase
MASSTRIGFDPAGPIPATGDLAEELSEAIDRGAKHLLSLQSSEGYWMGELEADTTLESDYIFYLHILKKADSQRVAKLANYIRQRQLPDGGWNIYFGGPSELNATVKAYFALKLAGDHADQQHMIRARSRVLQLGGLEATNSYTRFYLALVGAVVWDMAPSIPPELMLLPSWLPLNIYEMSSWTRGIVIPLAILYAHKPKWQFREPVCADELFCNPKATVTAFAWGDRFFSWRNFFLALDRACKLYERVPWKPFRRRALRQAERWLLEHLERSDGLGAIYPAMMNAVFALVASGYPPDDPLTAREIGQLASYEIEGADTLRLQPCISPVWDTAIAMVALEEAGLPANDPALIRAAKWLIENQVLGSGDWQVKNFYPDVDDTAFVLMALQRVDCPDKARLRAAAERGVEWLLSMQNRDGGWGAFDHNNDRRLLTHIPFADHNAMIDPSSADVTARVLECLGRNGWPADDAVVKRGVAYLMGEQTSDGSWYGRWGVNYVYGTSGVLRALETLALSARNYCQRAVSWLRAVQNGDGGFGESIASYDDPSLKGQGVSTPSQTAWGLIGLLAAADRDDPAVGRAVKYLLERQNADGSWDEEQFTGTGFPSVFYLKYHLYRNYFPLYALSRHRNLHQGVKEFHAFEIRPEREDLRGATRGNG